MALDFLSDFGKAFVPKSIRPRLRAYIESAGIRESPYWYFGMLFALTLILTFIIFFGAVLPLIGDVGPILQFVFVLVGWALIQFVFVAVFIMIIYFYLDLKIFKRIQIMEAVFPDFLALVSTNLKGGMNLNHAIFSAIRPQFGPLATEMTIISKKVMTGYDLTDALTEFSQKYNSPMIRRALNLIIGEIEIGSGIAQVLDQMVANLKKTQKMKAEMSASVVTYMIFIGAIVVVIAPVLFALSFRLLEFMSEITIKLANSGANTSSVIPFTFSKDGLSTDLFRQFSYVAIFLISTFSSMIISIIEKGDIRSGLKYVPVFIIASLVVYSVFLAILGFVFGGLTL